MRNITNGFIISFINSGNVIFNLLFFYLLFSTLALSIFKGAIEFRCRITEKPELITTSEHLNKTIWLVDANQNCLCSLSTDFGYNCQAEYFYFSIIHSANIIFCKNRTFCGSNFEYGLPWNQSESDTEALNYGISNYNNIFYSALSGLNFLTFTGWSNINDIVINLA